MAGYPYHSPPPPPSPPCNSTTSPILPPPPPPPSPPCNTTTTPKLQPPPPPACTCNKATPTLPPPPLPSPPPPSHYYPPVHSPPPPSPSHPSPLSPPPPPPFNYSPPVLPPPSSPSPPPPSPPSSYFPSPQPTLSPPSSDYSPPPSSQSPSPWATSPNHYNSIPPNYNYSIAPGPQFSSPGNGQRTAIVTTFVSLGGVFFLAFIVIGLLSMAMKKRMPGIRMPRNGTGQPGSSEDRHNFESIPAGKPTEYSDIEMGGPDPDTNLVEGSKVQTAPPDQRIVQQAQDLQTSISSGADNTSADPNVGQDSFNDNQGEVDDSDTKSSKPPGEQSAENMDAPAEDADEEESNESKKKPRLPKNKKSQRKSGAKKGKENPSGIRQLLNAAGDVDLDEAQQSEDGDNDEEQVRESNPEDEGKELISGGSNTADEKGEHSIADEQQPDERHGEPFSHQSETNSTDSAQHVEEEPNAAEQESEDSKNKLSLPKKKKSPSSSGVKKGKEKPSSSRGAKKGKENPSGILQVAKAAYIIGAEESEDGDNDEDQVPESNPEDNGEELISGGTNTADEKVENSNADEQEPDERHGEPLSHQIETKNTDSAQHVEEEPNAAEQESKDSKSKLSLPNKERSPSSSGVKNGKEKLISSSGAKKGKENPSGILQVAKAAYIIGAEESEDGDNNEDQVPESNPEDDGEELISGGSNTADEKVEHSNADEQEPDERHSEPLSHQIETKNTDSAQHVEEEPNAAEQESKDSKSKLSLPKKERSPSSSGVKNGKEKPISSSGAKKGKENPSGILQFAKAAYIIGAEESEDGDNDEDQVPESNPDDDGEELISGGSNTADEKVEHSNADEQEPDERHGEPLNHQSETKNTDSAQHVEEESNAAEQESKDSKSKLSLPKKERSPSTSGVKKGKEKPSSNSGAKKGKENPIGILQFPKAADIIGAEELEDGDNDEDQVPESNPEDDGEELILGGSNNADEKVEHSDADEQEPDERHGEPLLNHQSETKNTDSAQHVEEESNAAEQESKDSKSKLSLPKKERSPSTSGVKKRKGKPSSNSGAKMGKENPSGILQFAKATDIFSVEEVEELKDGDNDEEQEPESNPEDDGEELISGGLNHADENVEHSIADEQEPDDCHGEPLSHQSETKNTDSAQHVEEESNAVEEESNECSHKPLSNQSETKNIYVTQDMDKVYAAGKDSNDSKRNSRPPKKDKASSSRRHPQGKVQHSIFDQVLNATDNIYQHGGVQSQEDDNDEAEVLELGSHNDGEELDLGGSKNVDEGVKRQSDEHEVESDKRHCNPLINQSESDNIEATQYQEKEPYEGEKKPYGLEEKSYESEKRSLQTKNPSGRLSGQQKPFKFGQALNIASNVDLDGAVKSQEDDDRKAEVQESEPQEDGGDLNLGGPNNANEDVELPSKVDEEISDEPLCNKIESGDIEVTQDVEQQSDEKRKLINSKETFFQKKKHSSHLTGKQKASIVGQVSDVLRNFDLDGAMQSQDIDADEVEVHESESQNDFEKLEVASSKKDQRGQQACTRARSREEPLNLERLISTASGTDSSRAMVSLVDEEGKVEELNPFASAPRGGKQALSKATVPELIQITATNVDDSSEELKSVGADNYKDNKAKAHEVKFGGSKKDLLGRQHHTQEREELKLFNLEKVVTTASGSDSGKALVSFDDEDEKIQESEPIASNVDSYFQQPLSSQGIDQSPNLVQILTSTIDDDPNVELKSLGDGDYKGRKAEVYQLSKDSRKIKGHTMGARTRIEPPNLDQIVTARIGDDLGEGLESLGGNQEGESDKDGSNKDLPGSGQTSRGTQQLPNLVQILTATNEGNPNPELEFCEDDKELELEYSMRDLSLQEAAPGEIEPSTDDQSVFATVDDDPDVVQFHYNEYDEEPAESNKDGRTRKPLSRPPTTSLRGKRRA